MRKILFATIAALMVNVVNAQEIQFGVRGGLNISKESDHVLHVLDYGTIVSDIHFRQGFNIGGLVNIQTADRFELEAGVSYSMLGYRDKFYVNEASSDYTFAKVMSHYLSIPIAEKFYPFRKGLYIELGPQFGFLLLKKGTLLDEEYIPFGGVNNKTFDFAVFGGLGYKFANNIFVNARYIHSFTETSKSYEGGKNRNIQISLGYLF